MKEHIVKLVTFGRGGDSLYCTGRCHVSGYGNPERPHAAVSTPERPIPDGTPAIDMREAVETDAGFSWAIKGPMVDVDLPEDGYSTCPQPSGIMESAMIESGNAFGSLLVAQSVSRAQKEERGPLDGVSIKEYIEGWRSHGARIGSYVNGSVIWEG